MRTALMVIFLLAMPLGAAAQTLGISAANAAEGLDMQAVESAGFSGSLPSKDRIAPLTIKVEVLLDRAHFSPGEIDGKLGENVGKALSAYSDAYGLPAGTNLTNEIWSMLSADTRPVLTNYVLTERDLKGPFLKKVPAKMEGLKGLKVVSYRNVSEALAEKFHMSERLLAVLNPRNKLDQAGQQIIVTNVIDETEKTKRSVARIEVDKGRQTVKAYSQAGDLLAFYPATVGSEEKPTPDGTLKIISVDPNPTYRYNPDYKFRGVKSKKAFVIGPGPNNPVGIEWIGLSEEGYGIHGTPEPSKVSKSESHGCVRLTNWDAVQLASMVKKGVPVEFESSQEPRGSH
jgi:lipoprotein-anchoring transpeptidase ErfK/SrfK